MEFSVLVVTDILNSYTESTILFGTTADTIIKSFMSTWISKYNIPDKCLTDNGRQFVSSRFKDFIAKYNKQHILTTPNNISGNSIFERINKEIGVFLRILLSDYL
ncbi:Gag-Pro-Pol polyprotein [Dictyocoela muelleri]|nr:Gag-Pro-Pol polyprotein [Dictyocoela muelleri]